MTKRITLLTLLLATLIALPTSASVIISGQWTRKNRDVSLFKIVSGRLETLCTYYLDDDDRSFGFCFDPKEEGFYVIGGGVPQSRIDKYTFYFKPGDALHIEVNDNSFVLTGENTPENKSLTAWHDWIQPLEWMAVYFGRGGFSTYVDFFPALEEKLANPFDALPTPNKRFNEAFALFREYDLVNTAFYFLNTPRSAHPQQEDYPDFYRNFDMTKLTGDDSLMDYPFGSGLITTTMMALGRIDGSNRFLPLDEALALIKNNTLKGEYLLWQASRIKTYLGYKEMMAPYRQCIVTPDQKRRETDIIARLAKEDDSPVQPAINFTARDINGKTVSLSDFNGKVVLVDVWATWCGPCKEQTPFLKKMIKDFEGKDVVIMSVSVDEEKDLQKWKDFVKAEKLGGVQLFAGGFNSDICKFYDIRAIPRFMLFDKKGNVVSKDSPRPSSTELKLLIEEELKK